MNTNRETDCYGLGEFWGRLNAFWAVKSPSSVNVFAFGSALLIGVVDYFTGPEIAFSVFYLLPIMLAAWFAGKRSGILLAVFSSLIWLLADLSAVTSTTRALNDLAASRLVSALADLQAAGVDEQRAVKEVSGS